jgi:hypothetical protein
MISCLLRRLAIDYSALRRSFDNEVSVKSTDCALTTISTEFALLMKDTVNLLTDMSLVLHINRQTKSSIFIKTCF